MATMLTTEEKERFDYLVNLLNDTTVTQLDTDEQADFSRLLGKLLA